MFSKVLIANRGEIAVRIMRACEELGIATVAVYSELDRDAIHVRRADEAYLLGPGPASESYLVIDKLLDAVERSGARGGPSRLRVPGRERRRSRPRSRSAGSRLSGRPSSAIEAMGSKTRARELMAKAGVPIVPGTTEPVATIEDAQQGDRGDDRLPGRGQGGRRRRRQGLPRRAGRGRSCRTPSRAPPARARSSSPTRRCTSSATCPTRGTSRCRCWPTRTAT